MSTCHPLSPETDWHVREDGDIGLIVQSNSSFLASRFSEQWIIQGEQADATLNSAVHIFINLLQAVAAEEVQEEARWVRGTEAAALQDSWIRINLLLLVDWLQLNNSDSGGQTASDWFSFDWLLNYKISQIKLSLVNWLTCKIC